MERTLLEKALPGARLREKPPLPNRHLLGFRFFNRIYQRFDLDTVRRCILCYALPDVQSPEEFLKRVRSTEPDTVYDFVQRETRDILSRFPQG